MKNNLGKISVEYNNHIVIGNIETNWSNVKYGNYLCVNNNPNLYEIHKAYTQQISGIFEYNNNQYERCILTIHDKEHIRYFNDEDNIQLMWSGISVERSLTSIDARTNNVKCRLNQFLFQHGN